MAAGAESSGRGRGVLWHTGSNIAEREPQGETVDAARGPTVLAVLVPRHCRAAGGLDKELGREQRDCVGRQQRRHQPCDARVEAERGDPRLGQRLRRLVQAQQPLRRHRGGALRENALALVYGSGEGSLCQELRDQHEALGAILGGEPVVGESGEGLAHDGRRSGLPACGGVVCSLGRSWLSPPLQEGQRGETSGHGTI